MVYCIRHLLPSDVEAVIALEQQTLSPWLPSLAVSKVKTISLVAVEAGGSLGGWCCCRIVPPEAELLKISVNLGLRRQGLASALLLFLCDQLAREHCHEVFLEVRGANTAAIGLYNQGGFAVVGRRHHYYTDPVDDAILMKRTLAQAGQVQKTMAKSGGEV